MPSPVPDLFTVVAIALEYKNCSRAFLLPSQTDSESGETSRQASMPQRCKGLRAASRHYEAWSRRAFSSLTALQGLRGLRSLKGGSSHGAWPHGAREPGSPEDEQRTCVKIETTWLLTLGTFCERDTTFNRFLSSYVPSLFLSRHFHLALSIHRALGPSPFLFSLSPTSHPHLITSMSP